MQFIFAKRGDKMSIKASRPVRKHYSPEFKDQALAKASLCGVAQAAHDLGVSKSMLYNWRSMQQQGGDTLENQKLQAAELAQLKREIKRLSDENTFLKKAAAYFAKEMK